MWTEVKRVPSLILAEMWKEFFEAEGVPARILPVDLKDVRATASYRVFVPKGKEHVAEEALRKA